MWPLVFALFVAGPVANEPWTAPPWSELGSGPRRDINRYSDSTAYEAARNDRSIETRRWRYRSDSSEVVALVALPKAPRAAIVYCRGSYLQDGRIATFLPLLQRLAHAGYPVIAPQYRGSEGGTGTDEMGGADVEDVLQAVRLAAETPGVKAVFLYGESRGGMMVFQACARALACVPRRPWARSPI
jgi:dipeptidyl aminopeptidase/acylaminoacyl peptidase